MLTVKHLPCLADPATGSMQRQAWVYRTEMANIGDRRLRVVWFEFYYRHDDTWFGVNVRNRPLGHADFVGWYGDPGGTMAPHGWLEPGATAVCDPNWHLAFGPDPYPAKWCYLAVDDAGRETFSEATVPAEAVRLYSPASAPSADQPCG